MLKKFFLIIFVFITLFGLVPQASAAGKFNTQIKREYWIQDDLSVKVKESETISNNTSNLYIPSGSAKEFEILAIEVGDSGNKQMLEKSLKTVKLYANNTPIAYTSSVETDVVKINAKFSQSLEPQQSITFTMEYTHYGLMEQNGALKDFFLNGFSKDSVFQDDSNTTSYSTLIYYPKNLPEVNFVTPSAANTTADSTYTTLTFNTDSLLGHYIWIQFGKTQNYKFKISQAIKKSENLNTGNKNRYEIVIPRDVTGADIDQVIYYTSISPSPEWVKQDEEGNLIASFKLNSNFEGNVVIEGYAQLEKTQNINLQDLGVLESITSDMQGRYLNAAEYWEVDDSLIKQTARDLKKDSNNIGKIVETTYEFVINKIDYSEVKRFGLNERQGAVKTLQGGAAVCMEYSDLFLSLMRAQGVPARAAFGYGYDPKLSSDSQESHQWVEVYSPKLKNWISVDVTWGENGPALIGGDLNHFYTHLASISPNEPPGILSYGFGKLDLETAEYDIEVTDSLPAQAGLTQAELITTYPYEDNSLFENVVELTQSKLEATYNNITNGDKLSADQIVIITSVGVLSLVVLFLIIATIKKLVNRR